MDSNQDASNLETSQTAPVAGETAQLENGEIQPESGQKEDLGIGLGFDALGLESGDEDQSQANDAGSLPTRGPDFTDLGEMIKSGEKDKALERLPEIQKGVEKLARQAQDGQSSVQELQYQAQLFQDVSSGNRGAAEYFAKFVQDTTGWTLREIADYVDAGGNAPARGNGADPQLAKLQARIDQLEGKTKASHENVASAQWMNTDGKAVVDHVAAVTGRQYTPAQVWEARQYLKGMTNPTAAQIEKAIMKVNPDYYFEADNRLKASSNSLPAGASVPRGGQLTKVAPVDVMSKDYDRQHAEQFRRGR